MLNKFVCGIVFCALNQFSSLTYGGTWETTKNVKHNLIYLTFKGEIVRGDARKLAQVMIDNGPSISLVNLDSPGGNIAEAIEIGEMIKALRIDTTVQKNATCASACFFIWINGSTRTAGFVGSRYFGPVGLHRPYLTSMQNSNAALSEQNSLMARVSTYLDSKVIPRRFSDLMLSRASNEIYWMTAQDIEDIRDVPPDLEELYVSRCRDNRRALYRQVDAAHSAGNQELIEVLKSTLLNMWTCIETLNFSVRASEIKRLADKLSSR